MNLLTNFLIRFHAWSQSRIVIFHLATAVIVLYAPSMWLGLAGDMAYMVAKFKDPTLFPFDTPLSPFSMFTMGKANAPAELTAAVSQGLLPWWTSPQFHFQLWRPLTEFSHYLDFALFDKQTWLMHVHQIGWLLLLLIVTQRLFVRLFEEKTLAIMSVSLFILSGNLAQAVTCLDGRNTLIASVLGITSLLFHIENSRNHEWRHKLASYLFFCAALLSSEFGLGASAWIFSWIVFMESGSLWKRAIKLAPYGLLMIAWALFYTGFHYGVAHSAIYIDPVRSPMSYFAFFLDRIPGLLFQAITSIPYTIIFPSKAGSIEWWIAVSFITLVGILSFSFLKQPIWRFLLVASCLSTLPVAAGPGGGRTLTFVSLGLMPFTANILLRFFGKEWQIKWKKIIASIVTWPTVTMFFLGFLEIYGLTAIYYINDSKNVSGPASRLPVDIAKTDQTLVLLNPNSIIFAKDYQSMRTWLELPRSKYLYALSSGQTNIEIKQDKPNAFTLKPDNGFLYNQIDYFMRPKDLAFTVGEVLNYGKMSIEVTELTSDGRPQTVRFAFNEPLISENLKFLICDRLNYIPLAFPLDNNVLMLPPCERP